MHNNVSHKTFEHYDRIARLERSKAFHAGLAAIAAFFKTRPTRKTVVGARVA